MKLQESGVLPLPESLGNIFHTFMAYNAIQLSIEPTKWFPNVDPNKSCPFHKGLNHIIENTFQFYDFIYDLHEVIRLNWDDIQWVITAHH